MHENDAYGYVNGQAVYSRDEWIFKIRGFGPIESDEELLKYAEKVTSNWYYAGWHQSFISYYISDYALSDPYQSLTIKEFNRLKELQKAAQERHDKEEEAKEWKHIHNNYWADNSVEEVWENKYGERKVVMVTGPHGDIC